MRKDNSVRVRSLIKWSTPNKGSTWREKKKKIPLITMIDQHSAKTAFDIFNKQP